MGAVVEIVGTAARTWTVFTDGAGFYSASDLLPGLYTVKGFGGILLLPAWRDKVGLHPGTSTHLNITLNTLLNAMRVGRCAAPRMTTIGSGRCVRWRIVPCCGCSTILL
jgi:hypothetical protein